MNRLFLPICLLVLTSTSAFGQTQNKWTPIPIGSQPPPSQLGTSTVNDVAPIGSNGNPMTPLGELSKTDGQIWREYNIRSFTQRVRDQGKPEQAIIDWILRETGTSTWFGETMSLLSANSDVVRVYHTPEVQETVNEVIERFLSTRPEANEVGVRLVSVGSPDWRVKALPILKPVQAQTPGIEAWILSRENAALLQHELNQRPDYREFSSPNLTIYSGQTHTINNTRPRMFNSGTNNAQNVQFGVAGLSQVDEGFSLQISPLVGIDGKSIEAVIKCQVEQIEGFTPLSVNQVDQFGTYRRSEVKVPQVSSWQLHERFRWPTNEVLLISRGLVASPGPASKNSIRRFLGGAAPKAEALLFLESKLEIDSGTQSANMANRTDAANYRGRY